MTRIITLCTGNAARSVMAGAMLEAGKPGLHVITAGTHVIDGQPVSWRTRDALATVGLDANRHRSAQLRPADLATTDLILAMAGEHVRYIRREHPEVAARTVTLKRLAHDLEPGRAPLRTRVAELGPANVVLEDWEDVEDPAGGAVEDYIACAEELLTLIDRVVDRL